MHMHIQKKDMHVVLCTVLSIFYLYNKYLDIFIQMLHIAGLF